MCVSLWQRVAGGLDLQTAEWWEVQLIGGVEQTHFFPGIIGLGRKLAQTWGNRAITKLDDRCDRAGTDHRIRVGEFRANRIQGIRVIIHGQRHEFGDYDPAPLQPDSFRTGWQAPDWSPEEMLATGDAAGMGDGATAGGGVSTCATGGLLDGEVGGCR